MIPEHYQLIISDLYEENYKSNFAKDLRENINDLTDLDWVYQVKFNRSSIVGGGGGVGSRVGGFVVGVGSGVGSRVGGYVGVGGGVVGFGVGGDNYDT